VLLGVGAVAARRVAGGALERWEQTPRAYRVSFRRGHAPRPGIAAADMALESDEYELTDADVTEVLSWASARCGRTASPRCMPCSRTTPGWSRSWARSRLKQTQVVAQGEIPPATTTAA
jgi:hypothetical protein